MFKAFEAISYDWTNVLRCAIVLLSINSAVDKFTECINSVASHFSQRVLNQPMLVSLKMQIGLILSVLMQRVIILMHNVYSSKITLVEKDTIYLSARDFTSI